MGKISVFFISLSVIICFGTTKPLFALELAGKVTRLRGEAYVLRAPQKAGKTTELKRQLFKDADIFVKDRIQTGEKSYIRLEMTDGSILSLGEKGNLFLSEFAYSKKKKKEKHCSMLP
jgi:hypothetical protein